MPNQPCILHVSDRWSQLKGIYAFVFLFCFALLVRFPFFFPAVIDWDESTFILMGQSIIDGHLPYVKLWDLKPPAAYAFYAFSIALFGRDLVGIRFAGALCVVLTALLVYLIGSATWARRTGLIAAMLCVVVIGVIPAGQATMTEHVVLLPLMSAFYLLIRREVTSATLFLVGVLLALATLTRQNVGFVVIAVGLYVFLVSEPIGSPIKATGRGVAYILGGIIVIAGTWIPYKLAGQDDLLWTSVISAPLSYANSQYSIFVNLISHIKQTWGAPGVGTVHGIGVRWLHRFLWLCALGGLGWVLWRWQNVSTRERRTNTVLFVFMIGTGFGILKSGTANEHYLIQLVPFEALLVAALIHHLPRCFQRCVIGLACILILLSSITIVREYRTVVSRILAHKNLRHGAAYQIADYLKNENALGRPVYLLTDNIVYWFTNSYPPTKIVTHPSNIAKPYLLRALLGDNASTEEELRKVFRMNPEFVIIKPNTLDLRDQPKALLDEILRNQYTLTQEIDGRKIFRKKKSNTLLPASQVAGSGTSY